MRQFYSVLVVVLLLLNVTVYAQEPGKRMIYAHYMGCFPPGLKSLSHYYRRQHKYIDPANMSSMEAQQGSHLTNWPLLPQAYTIDEIDLRQSAELEIQRAMRIGLDGFAIDAWAGGDFARSMVKLFLEICKEKQLPFYITVCMDPSCHAVKTDRYDDSAGGHIQGMYDTVRNMLSNFGDHPNLARRDGKPLIFFYGTQGFLPKEKQRLGAGKNESARWREKLIMFNGLREMVRKEFNTELFLHHDIDNAFLGVDLAKIKDSRVPNQPGPIMAELAGYLATGDDKLQGQDAIGGFMGGNWEPEFEAAAKNVQKVGKTWSIPMWHQYNNLAGSLRVEPGTNVLRRHWDMARSTNSTLIQYVTWNDYGEDTGLAPGTATRYTISDLTAHEIKWWKTGKEPIYDHDKVYLTYRRFPAGSSIFPFNGRRFADGVLEVASILTKPATIQLPGRSASYEAPTGLYVKQFPLSDGPVIAKVIRDGKVALEVNSPDPISNKPWREANAMVCYSSEYERQWKIDFPNTPVEYFAEYGDADNDGLPNWFEMLWFGKLGDYTTATLANPQDDPDGDGLTNLQEYQQQTDPRQKELSYHVGFVWDLATVHKNGLSFNPDTDANRHRVWHYLYNLGEYPVPMDGNYIPCPVASPHVSYAGDMVLFLPVRDEQYKKVYGWIARHKNPDDGSWMIQLKPNRNSNTIIAWKSPIAGTVSVHITTVARKKFKSKSTLVIQRSDPLETVARLVVPGDQTVDMDVPSVAVKAGDMIYIIGTLEPGYINLMLQSLKITLLSM